MTNTELIKALRHCGKGGDVAERCLPCDYYDREPWCEAALVNDAAAALEADEKRIAELEAQLPKDGEWIMDEHPHDGDCRCSVCLVAIDAMHERNHGLLNALTGGKWWRFYHFCPNCGAKMKRGEHDERTDS